MNPAHARILLLCLVAGCTTVAPEVPVAPEAPVATQAGTSVSQPGTPAPGSAPPAPATVQPAPPGGTSAARAPQAPIPAAPAAAAPAPRAVTPPAAAVQAPAAAPPLDLKALKEQLKETQAIGVLTKLSLKNQVDDLLQQFRDYYGGKTKVTLVQLRHSYEALLMKVLSLVQDNDRKLATSIVASREPIWNLLSDPKKFATLAV